MKVIGVDPGTRFTGVGLIQADGNRYALLHAETLKVPPKASPARKLRFIQTSLRALLEKYRPDIMSLENIFYGKDLRAMVRIGEARACAMLAASETGIDVVEYAPARVKQSVTGNGRATKEQVQHMVKTLLNMKQRPTADSADALAVALCHLHMRRTVHSKIMSV